MFYDFFIKREVFFNFNKKENFNQISNFKLLGLFDFFKIKFSKPRLSLSKNSKTFSNFPFLVLSNGSLVFYNSAYCSFLVDSKLNQTGLVLFDDLYSYKNKVVY